MSIGESDGCLLRGRHYYGLKYDPDFEVFATVGGTEVVFITLMASMDPSDGVKIPDMALLTMDALCS